MKNINYQMIEVLCKRSFERVVAGRTFASDGLNGNRREMNGAVRE